MDLNNYQNFVENVTSEESNNFDKFIEKLHELNTNTEVNIPLLLNSAAGLTAEAGEFMEIPKKCYWQGKPLDEATIFHMKRELGDVIFYWMNACRSLNLDPEDVINENINKLQARYSDGKFKVEHSENRKTGDL